MNHKEFEKAFKPTCRTLFNWRRFSKEKWPIKLKIIDSKDELGKLSVTWTKGEFGSARLPVKQAGEGRKSVLRIAADMAAEDKCIVLALPAFQATGEIILMDGCHRASALYLSGCSFRVILYVVSGTKDARGLWDLP